VFSYIIELTLFFVLGDDRVILYMGEVDDTSDAAKT